MARYESFDDWYEDNKERLSTHCIASALRNAWNNGRETKTLEDRDMTDSQKEAMQALFEIECKIADENEVDICEGPWCSARSKIRAAFKETEPEWDVQLPAKKSD